MTREEIKNLLSIIQTCIEDKEIQVKVLTSQKTSMKMNFRLRLICLRTARRSGLKNKKQKKMRKYELTSETKVINDVELHRIKALKSFGNIKEREFGGWIESEKNLSQYGDSWVYDNATVRGNAKVYDNATVRGNATVYDDAVVYDNATVCGNATISGNAVVSGDATISGDATVGGNATVYGNATVRGKEDFIVFKNWWSSGRYFTWTRSNNKWKVGCFYGSGEELIAKAYKDSEKSGREYERVVKYVESILKEENNDNE